MSVLLLNAGSSSLKASLMRSTSDEPIAQGAADRAGAGARYEYTGPDGAQHREEVPWTGHADAVRRFMHDLQHVEPVALTNVGELVAVGHRIVHGGPFTTSVIITPEIRARIETLSELAPLHNPPSLAALTAAESALPDVRHVAVFDTAFHATIAAEAYTYPLPMKWTRDWGIRRFGFHGLSYAYCAGRAAEMLGRRPDELRLVICHLGHGCSATAVAGGRSVDTTMGFTPLEGLMMGTRCGSIDPGIIPYVEQEHGLSAKEVETALNRESGLLGVSGVSADMRQVLAAAAALNQQARLAVAVYTHRIRQAIGALTVTLGGLDALVFTAGVGEHSAEVREAVCRNLICLGLVIDAQANERCQADMDISARESLARVLVIATREDVSMLREVRNLIGS